MKKILPIVALLALLGCASQAKAGIHVGVGIGVPFGPDPYGYGPDVYYGPGYYPWYHGYWHGGYHHYHGHYHHR